ncbi:MAG: hypothetical protein H6850_04535 [Alphaproteobacteria bacterium]|nr:MAG: hypothetical protein H6850_04535 [Alphaproteobacteria bacterium]
MEREKSMSRLMKYKQTAPARDAKIERKHAMKVASTKGTKTKTTTPKTKKPSPKK